MPVSQMPNAPLGEVVFELRFPGDLGVHAAWGALQKALRDEFPKLLVPKVNGGDFPALKPVSLASDDHGEQLALAVNSFAFVTRRYLQYDAFKARYAELLGLFLQHLRPVHLTRLGLRYLNWLPQELPGVSRQPGQLHGCLTLQLAGLPSGLDWSGPPVFMAAFETSDAKLNLQLGPDERGLRLDLDAYKEGEVPTDDVMTILDGLHQTIESTFFSVVTPGYLAYMKGELP